MQALKTIGREAVGLFVADARFTLALIGWIAIGGVAVASLDQAPGIGAISFTPRVRRVPCSV